MSLYAWRNPTFAILGAGFGAFVYTTWPRVTAIGELNEDLPGKLATVSFGGPSAITSGTATTHTISTGPFLQSPLPNPITDQDIKPATADSKYFDAQLHVSNWPDKIPFNR